MQKVYPSGLTLKVEQLTFTKDLDSAQNSRYRLVGVAWRNGSSQVIDVQIAASELAEVMAECVSGSRGADLANQLNKLAADYSLTADDIQALGGEELLRSNAASVLSGNNRRREDYLRVATILLLWQRAIHAAMPQVAANAASLVTSLESVIATATGQADTLKETCCIHCSAPLNTLQNFIDHYGEKSTCRPDGHPHWLAGCAPHFLSHR